MTKRTKTAAHRSATPIARVLQPMQKFMEQEQSSGIVLLAVTAIALVIANSALGPAYDQFLHTEVGIVAGPIEFQQSVLHWINDGLMAIFFFVVGLEIKREMLYGELSTRRAALLPMIAAVGGATVPALIFLAINSGQPSMHGWAVPMATDIAFALGCLALLGSRVPYGLKVFLTAVAIVDDLIAVLVIALFYSSELRIDMLAIGLLVIAALAAANALGVRRAGLYGALGVVVWLAFLKSGIHATVAGVLIALTVPARSQIDGPTFLARAHKLLRYLEPAAQSRQPLHTDEQQQSAVLELEELCEQVQAPLQKLEHELHGWVAFLIMPIFAFANAGVALSAASLSSTTLPVLLGIVLGLVLGKPLGLLASVWLAVRAGIVDLPQGTSWGQMGGVGVLAGIGFTMALFIASLAFADAARLDSAKLAIMGASLLAGALGMLILSRLGQAHDEVLE